MNYYPKPISLVIFDSNQKVFLHYHTIHPRQFLIHKLPLLFLTILPFFKFPRVPYGVAFTKFRFLLLIQFSFRLYNLQKGNIFPNGEVLTPKTSFLVCYYFETPCVGVCLNYILQRKSLKRKKTQCQKCLSLRIYSFSF